MNITSTNTCSSDRSHPLYGKRIVVTRPYDQAGTFIEKLKILGAQPIAIPAIEISPREVDSHLSELLQDSYDWIVFTSVNGVDLFFDAIDRTMREKHLFTKTKFAAIGPVTSHTLTHRYRAPDIMPAEYISDAIIPLLGDVSSKRILLARAAQARDTLRVELLKQNALVSELPMYDIVPNNDLKLVDVITQSPIPDFLTFTSASTVIGLHHLCQLAQSSWFTVVPKICIGPITAQKLIALGVNPTLVATDYTEDGLIACLSKHLQESALTEKS